jgi:phosphotransferase system HPr (HPr) family protein
MESREVTIKNKSGLHARPAHAFVQAATKFNSKITISKGSRTGSGKSIVNIIALGLTQGTEITISAEGEDEKQAVDTLIELVNSKFGEE